MSFWLSNRFKNCDLSKVQVFMFINKIILRILTGKKHRQIKLHRLEKARIWAFGLFTLNQLFIRGS